MGGSVKQMLRESRLKAADELIAMEVEVPLDPDELSRLLETANAPMAYFDSITPNRDAGRDKK